MLRALTFVAALFTEIICISTAIAQQPEQNLPSNTAIPSLMLFTLIGALVVALGAFAYFLRKRSNRAAASRAFSSDTD
jgi:hypothetical protein